MPVYGMHMPPMHAKLMRTRTPLVHRPRMCAIATEDQIAEEGTWVVVPPPSPTHLRKTKRRAAILVCAALSQRTHLEKSLPLAAIRKRPVVRM